MFDPFQERTALVAVLFFSLASPGCPATPAVDDDTPDDDTGDDDTGDDDSAGDDDTTANGCHDLDGDGYGSPGDPDCTAGPEDDCDDLDPSSNPGAADLVGDGIDQDCDGLDGVDLDGDGHASIASGGMDCDDADASTHPGVAEICDGVDNDCNGFVDGQLWCGALDLSVADAKFVGEEGGHAGWSIASAGDVDGDGMGDLIVGDHSGDGAVYMVRGPVTGILDLSAADARLVGEGGNAGYSVGAAGDANGDGFDDLLVGAPFYPAGSGAGVAYLVLGPVSGTVDLADADARLVGESNCDQAGISVAGAGDVDGDGFDDLLVGANGQHEGGGYAGAAYLVHGPVSGTVELATAAAKLVGEATNDQAGSSVSSAGDVDGDGYADLIVGAPYHALGNGPGAAYVLLGPVSGTLDLSNADAKLDGEVAHDGAGVSVASAGDVDGDGFGDLVIGANGHDAGGDGAGAAYLVLGPVSGPMNLAFVDAKLVGEQAADYAGYSVSGAGDLDGDGFGDLVIGASGHDEGGAAAGAAYVVLGPVSGTVDLSAADARLIGEAQGDSAGLSVSAAGDVDGDGYDDLLVGAPNHPGGYGAGAGYLVLGRP